MLKPFLQRLAGLETRVPVAGALRARITTIAADPDQLEQLLHQPDAQRRRRLARSRRRLGHDRLAAAAGHASTIWVDDEGPGLSNTANLFVPFFTTKPGGSGIGLVLCRQIAEAHEGSLRLENRADGRGCRATLTLPV